jgi:dihydroxyacetone kinase
LLSGAVAGTIFASPSAEQVRRCILQRVEKSKGVLVVVMNYTGEKKRRRKRNKLT